MAGTPLLLATVVKRTGLAEGLGRDAGDHDQRRLAPAAPDAPPTDPVKIDTSPPRGMRDLLPQEVELRDTAMSRILGVYRSAWIPARGDAGPREPEAAHGGWGRREREAHLQGSEARREAGVLGREGAATELADLGLALRSHRAARALLRSQSRPAPPSSPGHPDRPGVARGAPAAGRYRQFTQCDIDILGVESEVAEVELILATAEALLALGLTDLTSGSTTDACSSASPSTADSPPIASRASSSASTSSTRSAPPGSGRSWRRPVTPPAAVAALMTLLDEPALGKGQVDDVLRALPVDRRRRARRGPARGDPRGGAGVRRALRARLRSRRWCAGCPTTPDRSSRSATRTIPPRSPAAAATTA